jgi:hypothetical protein
VPTSNEPVEPGARLAINRELYRVDEAPRGPVPTFCAEHEIFRKTFYAIRARTWADRATADGRCHF